MMRAESVSQIAVASADCCAAKRQMSLFNPPQRAVLALDFHAFSRPAGTFTGDFYFTHRSDDSLWFALGDVAGKGLQAAVIMAMVQEELEERFACCARNRTDPASALAALHAFLRPVLPSNRFVSAVAGELWNDGTLVIANAGHCPPLIARADGGVERIGSTGPVIGILPSAAWTTTGMRLRPDDALLVYSDGLPEATSPEGDEFGVERIESVLSAHRPSRSASRITARLNDAVTEFSNDAREDDLTLIAIRM